MNNNHKQSLYSVLVMFFWLYYNYLQMYMVYLHIPQGCSIGTEPIVSLSQSLLNNPEIRLKVMEYDMDNHFYQIIAKQIIEIYYIIFSRWSFSYHGQSILCFSTTEKQRSDRIIQLGYAFVNKNTPMPFSIRRLSSYYSANKRNCYHNCKGNKPTLVICNTCSM